jgi:CHAD domain-containing protein
LKPRKVKGLDPGQPLRANAGLIVGVRLDEVRSLAEPALDPAAATAQHDLRIACKRLRYVLELVEDCFDKEASAARACARELQTVLGEIHDCDVMLPRAEGIESLVRLLRTRRELLFRRFAETWRAEATADAWNGLERALRA